MAAFVDEIDEDDDDADDFRSATKTIECAKALETRCGVSADLMSKLEAIKTRFTASEGKCQGRGCWDKVTHGTERGDVGSVSVPPQCYRTST